MSQTKLIKSAEVNIYLLPGESGMLIRATSDTNDGIKYEELFCPGIGFEFDLTDHRSYGYIGDWVALVDYLCDLSDSEPSKDWMRGIQLNFMAPCNIEWFASTDDEVKSHIDFYLTDDIHFTIEMPKIYRSYSFTHNRLSAYNKARSRYVQDMVARGGVPDVDA